MLSHSATLPSFLAPNAITLARIGVRLGGEAPFTSPKYGRVIGYFRNFKSLTSQVVVVPSGTKVVFKNVDASLPHTAAFLGDATNNSAPWPAHFNGGTSQSPAGAALNSSQFTTGTLTPGNKSLVYTTGAPGFYMFGCQFHYDPDGMRTVIIVR
jgi:plastocyanin